MDEGVSTTLGEAFEKRVAGLGGAPELPKLVLLPGQIRQVAERLKVHPCISFEPGHQTGAGHDLKDAFGDFGVSPSSSTIAMKGRDGRPERSDDLIAVRVRPAGKHFDALEKRRALPDVPWNADLAASRLHEAPEYGVRIRAARSRTVRRTRACRSECRQLIGREIQSYCGSNPDPGGSQSAPFGISASP